MSIVRMTDLDLAGRAGVVARCPIGSVHAGERTAMDGQAGRSEACDASPRTATSSYKKAS
jgi:hypothetical protein